MAEGGQELQNWRDGKSVIQCNRFMLEQEIGCDVSFRVGSEGNQVTIRAHKYMLKARSEVFLRMFDGPLAEQGNITVIDIEPHIFKKLLLYIYCDDTNIELNESFELLYAAQKYDVRGLAQKCEERMRTRISSENVCWILMNTFVWNAEETKQLCLQYLFHHSAAAFSSEAFLDLNEECLITILTDHKVNLKEEDIFKAVLKWADTRCERDERLVSGKNRRRYLIKILPYIRFPRMNPAYFTDTVSHMKILTDSELLEIYRFFTTNKADHPDPPRQRRLIIERFHGVMSGKGYFRGNADALSFFLSHDAKLHEILIYGSCQGAGVYKVNLKVLEDGDRKLCEKLVEIRTDGAMKTYQLMIEPPLPVKKDVCYTLLMVMSGPPSYFGKYGQLSVTTEGVDITFLPNERGLNGTNIKQGQFPGLVFEKV